MPPFTQDRTHGGGQGSGIATATAVFAAAFIFYCIGIGWGLPNGTETWASDAIKPGAPLSIFYRMFVGEPGNSGWFWFKYPLGHVFVLGVAYAPYLLWLVVSGGIADPTSSYPYGMSDPDQTLYALAITGRLVSVAMSAGTVTIAYLALRSFGRRAALAGAALTALCYPLVYYAHTTNVEAPYVFWLMVAFLGAVRLVEHEPGRLPWVFLGVGAAMSVASKELAAGFFVGLPPVILIVHWRSARPRSELVRGALLAAASCVAVFLLANNAFLNPSGLVHRLGFLTHRLPEEIALRYAPNYFPIDLERYRGLRIELAQLGLAGQQLLDSLGGVTVVAALAGLGLAIIKRPAWAALVLSGTVLFYLVGIKAMLSLSLRYVLPIAVLASMLAGIAIGRLLEFNGKRWLGGLIGSAVLAFAFLYGADVTRMLAHDSRYAAEAWMRTHALGQTVEVYQRTTYLPRFPSGIHVLRVPLEERDVNGLKQRNPDLIVLSTAGASGVTVKYKTDWDSDRLHIDQTEWIPARPSVTGRIMSYHRVRTVEMLKALEQGSLGYHETERFALRPWIPRPLIQSLNPEIVIYRRDR